MISIYLHFGGYDLQLRPPRRRSTWQRCFRRYSGDLSQLKITPDEGHDEPEDEEEDLDLSEIPLSEMTGQQMRQYAEQLGLKTEGLKKRELRELIRNHLK